MERLGSYVRISEIKKKAKLSIDEMYDNQPVGKLYNQKDGKQENHPTIHTENKPDFNPTGASSLSQLPNNKANQTTIQQKGKQEINLDVKQVTQTAQLRTLFPVKQQTQKIPT